MPDQLFEFLSASVPHRLEMARIPAFEPALTAYLGRAGLDQYRNLGDLNHLAPSSPPNLLFVPGVMGSLLANQQKGGVWWVDVRTRSHLDDIALGPDGTSDADPTNRVEPFTVDVSYEPFLEATLRRSEFGQELFPYDWRKPLAASADPLLERVQKMRQVNGSKPVHLVGHSMGGLMIRTALRQYPELWNMVGKIAFIGTPHYGSPAIASYLKHHFWGFDLFSLLGVYLSRKTFRSMWGVLSMLPAPDGVYPGTRPGEPRWIEGSQEHPAANFDLYDVEAYRLDDLDSDDRQRLQFILDWTKQSHIEMAEAHADLSQEQRDRMLMIAGVGKKTLFRLQWDKKLFGLWEKAEKVTDRIPGNPHREGDGRVPVASARLPHVLTRYISGVHGSLTNIPAVWEDVFRFLLDQQLELPESQEEALSDHLAISSEPAAPRLDGTELASSSTSEDPGFWIDAPLDQAQIEALDQRIEQGECPEFTRLRLL